MSATRGKTLTATRPNFNELVSLQDFEVAAQQRLSGMVFDYIAGGAGDALTLRRNREAYERLELLPRVLQDVSRLDTRINLFGKEYPFPLLLAPTAYHRLFHPQAELATVSGANAAQSTLVASTLSTTPIEDMAAQATSPLWFQLYIQPDRGYTKELVQRVEQAGCQVLCITVDTPVLGPRNSQNRVKFTLPPDLPLPHLKGGISGTLNNAHVTWQDIDWIRSFTRLPVVLKGILNPEDAEQAAKVGACGIIVSNHGGRNLDTVPATINALYAIVQKVAGRTPILIDGGVRRGTDMVKALALGAQAVLIGRPYLHGLTVAGAQGVSRTVNILRSEFELAMALTGRSTISAIDPSVIWTPPIK